MRILRGKPGMRGSARIFLAVVCAVLVLVCGSVQLIHTHAGGGASHADCALCLTAHVAVQAGVMPAVARVARLVAAVEQPPVSAPTVSLSAFALFKRPPPSAV